MAEGNFQVSPKTHSLCLISPFHHYSYFACHYSILNDSYLNPLRLLILREVNRTWRDGCTLSIRGLPPHFLSHCRSLLEAKMANREDTAPSFFSWIAQFRSLIIFSPKVFPPVTCLKSLSQISFFFTNLPFESSRYSSLTVLSHLRLLKIITRGENTKWHNSRPSPTLGLGETLPLLTSLTSLDLRVSENERFDFLSSLSSLKSLSITLHSRPFVCTHLFNLSTLTCLTAFNHPHKTPLFCLSPLSSLERLSVGKIERDEETLLLSSSSHPYLTELTLCKLSYSCFASPLSLLSLSFDWGAEHGPWDYDDLYDNVVGTPIDSLSKICVLSFLTRLSIERYSGPLLDSDLAQMTSLQSLSFRQANIPASIENLSFLTYLCLIMWNDAPQKVTVRNLPSLRSLVLGNAVVTTPEVLSQLHFLSLYHRDIDISMLQHLHSLTHLSTLSPIPTPHLPISLISLFIRYHLSKYDHLPLLPNLQSLAFRVSEKKKFPESLLATSHFPSLRVVSFETWPDRVDWVDLSWVYTAFSPDVKIRVRYRLVD